MFWTVLLSGLAQAITLDHALEFKAAQAIATGVAATSNFFLNNWLTYRDRRLKGWALLRGLVSFLAICSVGAIVSVSFGGQVLALFSERLQERKMILTLASLCGIAVGVILNYSATALFTWGRKGR